MGKFKTFIDSKAGIAPHMCLCHTCDANTFREVLDSNLMLANSTFSYNSKNVTDYNNLYMFYGRPAYRISKPEEPSKLTSHYPVCFILNFKKIGKIKRIFPFDTGAFHHPESSYSRFFHHNRSLSDFELKPNHDTPSKLISLFYENNEKYYEGIPLSSIDIPASELEVSEYYELIKDKGISKSDDRVATIELQIENDVEIDNGILRHIILPKRFLADDYFYSKLTNDWNLDKSDISIYVGFLGSPSSYFSVIFQKAWEFYNKSELF